MHFVTPSAGHLGQGLAMRGSRGVVCAKLAVELESSAEVGINQESSLTFCARLS